MLTILLATMQAAAAQSSVSEGLTPIAIQVISFVLGGGILVTLIRIAALAGRYMQRLEVAEKRMDAADSALLTLSKAIEHQSSAFAAGLEKADQRHREDLKELSAAQAATLKEVLIIQGHLRGQMIPGTAARS